MTLFYNPRTRKPRIWIIIVFIIIPLLLLIIGWIGTRSAVKKHKEELQKEVEEDIFNRF